jgi:Xaa-Pro aminopeptidase
MNKSRIFYWLVAIIVLVLPQTVWSQVENDWLDKEFHKQRREELRKLMPPKSVAVFFANPVRNRSNDVDYVYHPDPDFYYLTGYREPNGVLLIFSEEQKGKKGERYSEILFVQPKNEFEEMWNGKRMGVGKAKEVLGFESVLENNQFKSFDLNPSKFDKVFFLEFHDDVRDKKDDHADLFDLIKAFKTKVSYPENYSADAQQLYELIKTSPIENSANVAQVIGRYLQYYPYLTSEPLLVEYSNAKNDKSRNKVAKSIPDTRLDGYSLAYMMNSLREIKTPEEIRLLRKAIKISAIGQIEVMKAMHPGMSEREIQGIHEFVFKKYGAEFEGYPSIVGSGHNGCVLHYIENDRPKVGKELVLMDLGAQYRGYTADVTRTIPANGTFSPEQKQIYDLVYAAQEAGIRACKPGQPFEAPHKAAKAVINKGLKELGIISDENQKHRYFPHGTSHYLGLDVHDRGNYGDLLPGMVITVEPGIYIPEGSPCEEKWWGIAVRIEDDILITEDGYENLSEMAPRKSEEIEAMMEKESVLNQFLLPDLDD